jgi:alkylation response protein AidB-like acyl-CoA dehydrogenase
VELDAFRKSLDDWLDERGDDLAPSYEGRGTLDERMAQIAKVRRFAFDAGWARWGWPEPVGGFGGSTLLRAYLSEAVAARDLVETGLYSPPKCSRRCCAATRCGVRGSRSRVPAATWPR